MGIVYHSVSLLCRQFLSLMSYSFQSTGHSPPWLNLLLSESESENEVTQLCLTLCIPMGCSLLGSSVRPSVGFFQARILEWIAISSSRSSQPRD